jgi:AraC-like DNA-binding protein
VEPVQEWAAAAPRPALRQYVAGYQGYRQAGLPPARHAGLPSPYLTLILTLHEPLVIAGPTDPATPPDSYLALIGGLHTRPTLITHDGAQSGVQIPLHPLGARALLGLPAGELAFLDVDADAVLGGLAQRARELLLAAPSWPARFAVLDRLLTARLAAARPRRDDDGRVPREVRHAWRRLCSTGGPASVATLAEETGRSARHLRVLMRRETGLTPKAAARVIRFDRARRALAASRGRVTLADLAVATGYADQSHLDREFRALAGAPPSRWYAEEVRNVQVPPPEHLALSPA